MPTSTTNPADRKAAAKAKQAEAAKRTAAIAKASKAKATLDLVRFAATRTIGGNEVKTAKVRHLPDCAHTVGSSPRERGKWLTSADFRVVTKAEAAEAEVCKSCAFNAASRKVDGLRVDGEEAGAKSKLFGRWASMPAIKG